jgi:hypothetical protein
MNLHGSQVSYLYRLRPSRCDHESFGRRNHRRHEGGAGLSYVSLLVCRHNLFGSSQPLTFVVVALSCRAI